jgi:hypothetical protein
MENATAQPVQPGPTSPPPPAPIPTVDIKAPLKIETASVPTPEEPQINYGKKLFLFGVIFCGVIVFSVAVIAFLWMQNSNQTQKVITVEQVKK